MRSGSLVFFGLAVIGALSGLIFALPVWCVAVFLAGALVPLVLIPHRLAKALLVCVALITFVSWRSGTFKEAFDDALNTISADAQVYEGELVDLSDALSGGKIAVLNVVSSNINLALKLRDAASAKVMQIGDHIRVKGKVSKAQHALSPGQLDGYWYGFARGIHGRMTVSNPHHIAVMKRDEPRGVMARLKQTLKDELLGYLPPREAGLLLALIVGDVKLFDEDEKLAYRNIGAGHLLAVSGLQVSILSVIFYRCFLFLFLLIPWVSQRSLARYPTLVLTLLCVWGFVALCGSPPSAFRAALMASLVLCASVYAWPTTSADVFGASGFLSLLINPAWVVDPSFWLSYSAVFGLILAAHYAKIPESEVPLLSPEKTSSPVKEKLRAMALTSAGAGLLTLPFSIFYFGEVSLTGLIVNIVLVPVGGLLDSPAILSVAAGVITGWHFPFFDLSAFLASILESMVMTFDTWLGRTYPMMPLALWELVVATLCVILILASTRPHKRFLKIMGASLCVLVLFAPLNALEEEALLVTFIPVGQGDGAVLQIPPGKVMVIDGGGNFEDVFNPGERIIMPFLQRRGIDVIDVVVLSHPDADHLLGLIPLIRNFKVKELWHSDFDDSHPLMAQLLAVAHERAVLVRSLKELPDHLGVAKIDVITPPSRSNSKELNSTNNRSLVLRVSYKGNSVLFPGDVEAALEEALLGQDLSATIVKVPHHGSKGSSTSAFVAATKARHAVFCTGVNNRFGFPHSQAIKRWQDSGAVLWDTAVHGETQFRLAGNAVQVIPFRTTF